MMSLSIRSSSQGILAILLLAAPGGAWCQDPSTSAQNEHPKPAGASTPWPPGTAPDDEQNAGATPQAPGAGMPIDTERRVMGKAAPYAGLVSPFRLGPFSIDGAEYLHVTDQFTPLDSAPSARLDLGLFRTIVAFNKDFHRININLQYAPQVTFVNGQSTTSGAANNNLDFGTTFEVSPRLTLAVRNQFVQNQFRQVFPDQVLEVYRGVTGILPGDFLENNGTYMEENISAVLNYKITPRWTFTTQPMFRYLDHNDKTLNYNGTGTDIRERASLTYALTPHSNVGLIYNFEAGHTIRPLASDNYFTGIGGFYSQQLAKTLWIEGEFGAEVAFYYGAVDRSWLYTGGFSVVKSFSNTALAVSYARESQAVNYLGNRLDERVDVTYGIPLFRSLVWKNGAGYYHEVGPPPHTQGKYGQSGVDCKLPFNFVLSANYTYRFTHAQTLDLVNGTHSTLSFGLRWIPIRYGKR